MDQSFELGHKAGFHADNWNGMFRNGDSSVEAFKENEKKQSQHKFHFLEHDETNTIKKKEKHMEPADFEVDDDNLEEILAEIQCLRQDDEANGKLKISLLHIDYTHIVSKAILQSFRHCSRNGINFGRLLIYGFDGKELELERMISDANRLSLFTSIYVNSLILSEDATAALFDGFQMNQRLQSIKLLGCAFTRYSSKSLRRCLESNGPLQCLDLTCSTFFEDSAMILAEGLQANTTLQAIRLESMYNSVAESLNLGEVMTALTGHPKLRRIELEGWVIHDETCRALERLFSSPNCKIDSLYLADIEWETNGEPAYRGLKQCKYLKRIRYNAPMDQLEFENAGMVNLLDAVLPNCPRLESINLNNNNISSFTQLNSLVPMGQPSKIREFVIDRNPVWKNAEDADRDAILHFVRSNPELARLGEHFDFAESDLYTPLIEHYLDLNRSGKTLLSGNVSRPGIPLSVWPFVLERANQLFQENGRRQANVLYHLLGGPAFRARDNFLNVECQR
jgi:hypothetical protein